MSDSSLSDPPDMDFTSTPQRAAKHTLFSSSPISERPSKKIKLVYRKPSQPPSRLDYNPVQHQTSSPYQQAPKPELTLVTKLELQHLRENNTFLRRSNIELAKAHGQVNAQVGAFQEQVKQGKEETAEAHLQVERLKRENELLGTMTKDGFDPAAAAQRMTKLEEIRKIYWECGVEWARKETGWGVEKELFKKEVTDLVGKVQGLEGELAEERAKVRRFEGEMLELERGQSMRRGVMGGGQYGQQMIGNGIPDEGDGGLQMHGLGTMVASKRGRPHVMAPSLQLQRLLGRGQRQMSAQGNRQQQSQDMKMMRPGQDQGYTMMSGALALQDLGRGQAHLHGQEQYNMPREMTMQEQFAAQQQEQDAKTMMSPGQFAGLLPENQSFGDMLTGSEIDRRLAGQNGLTHIRNGRVEPWELQAMMGSQSGELKLEDNDMNDWEAPDDEDGLYDPRHE